MNEGWKERAMARTRFRSDRGLSLRMGGVGLGLGALYVAFGAVLIFYSGSAILGLVITVALAWGQWYFSDRLALKSIGGREVTPEQAPELHAMIDRLCVLADMPKPRVAVAVTDMPNAFATGRTPNHSVVCVTTGIMQRLDADELEGVLSHELAHVANRDVSVMTVASSLGLLAGFITRWGFYFGGGRNRGNNGGGGVPFLVVFLVSMAVYFISFLLTRALSRYRELSADRSGAYLTGRPSKLASALVKISGEMSRIPNKDLRDAQALSAFFIAPAINRESIGAIMSTHPPLQQRLDQLAKVGSELGEPA
jgi:heat shock protein HtpX